MDRVAQRVKDGRDVFIDARTMMPHVGHWQCEILGERPRPVYADAAGVRTEMPPTSKTVSTTPADHVTFAAPNLPREEVIYIAADFDDFAHELVSNHHGNGNGPLRPVVPFVDVQIGSADAGAPDFDEDVI